MTRRHASSATLRPVGRRWNAVLGILDQAVSSLGNVLVVVVAAVLLDARGFGAYSIAYIASTLLISCNQALVGQAVVLTDGDRGVIRAEGGRALALSFMVGCVTAAALVAIALAIEAVRHELLVAACALPLLLVQDTMRHCAAALRASQHSLLIDAIWLGGTAASVSTLVALDVPVGSWHLVAAWVVPGALSGLVGLRHFAPWRETPSSLWRRYGRTDYLGVQFLVELVVMRATSQAMVLGIAPVAGLAASGALRGVTTLFGPLNVLITAMTSFGPPLIARGDRRKRNLTLLGMALPGVTLSVAVTLSLMLLPGQWGSAILGETWPAAHSLVLPTGVLTTAAVLATAALLGLRMTAPRATFSIRLVTSALVMPAFVIGYLFAGLVGAAWGLSVPVVVQMVWLLAAYARSDRQQAGQHATPPHEPMVEEEKVRALT